MIVSEPTEALRKVLDINELLKAFNSSSKIGHWKRSYQIILHDKLEQCLRLQESVLNGTYHLSIKEAFILCERGKIRYIRSLELYHMALQKSLCNNIIIPRLRNTLIYDNGASLKGKGVGFAKKRFEKHLRLLYRFSNYNADNCYILFGDFSKFFDNIDHGIIKEQLRKLIPEDDIFENIILDWLKASRTDVSYMTDEEFEEAKYGVFNSIEHEKKIRSIPKKNRTKGKKILCKGLGIGAQLSQVAGIMYLNPFDHYCKEVLHCKLYGRYMDDFYIMTTDKNILKDLIPKLQEKAKELKLQLHPKKFRICKLSAGVTYLKTRYKFIDRKLLRFINPKIITKQSRKITKFHKLLLEGRMCFTDILKQFKGWLGEYGRRHFTNRKAIYKLKMKFKNTFGVDIDHYK